MNDDWTNAVRAIKHSVWGEPYEPEFGEMYFDKFSPVTGEVVAGWNSSKYAEMRVAGWRKTSTKGAHSVSG